MPSPLPRSAAIVAVLILAVASASPAEAKRRGHGRGPIASTEAFLGSLFGGVRTPPRRRVAAARRPARPTEEVPVAEAALPPQRQALADLPPPVARGNPLAGSPPAAAPVAVPSVAPGGGWIDPVR